MRRLDGESAGAPRLRSLHSAEKGFVRKMLIAFPLLACALLAWWLWTPDRDRSLLETRYLVAPADMMQLAGWRLHVRDSGPRYAPAVILIHGFGASLQTWDAWAVGLDRKLRVIRFDLPGSGLSPPDPAANYTDARSVELLLALMDRLGLQRASIVGHSIGGRIAWTFAATHPERVDRLVLVSPDGFASPGFEYGKAPEIPSLLGLIRYALPKPVLRMNLHAAYADPKSVTDALINRYDDLIRAPGARQALLDRMRQTVLVDPRPLLAVIRAPTLLVWGERDAMIPFANSAEYLTAMPEVRLVSFPAAGHVPQEEAAADSLVAVDEFLTN
jgi:pimeloyl-ACP methyl ester carboxylesterase